MNKCKCIHEWDCGKHDEQGFCNQCSIDPSEPLTKNELIKELILEWYKYVFEQKGANANFSDFMQYLQEKYLKDNK